MASEDAHEEDIFWLMTITWRNGIPYFEGFRRERRLKSEPIKTPDQLFTSGSLRHAAEAGAAKTRVEQQAAYDAAIKESNEERDILKGHMIESEAERILRQVVDAYTSKPLSTMFAACQSGYEFLNKIGKPQTETG